MADNYQGEGIPVFLINGFLESGKTSFIQYTMNQDYFQTKVTVTKGKKRGQLTLQFYNEEDLTRLLELMGIEVY